MSTDLITNRKVLRDYHILETYEAGIVLQGTEVKALRQGKGNLNDAFARIENGQASLYQFDIQPYEFGNRANHEARAVRRLLLNKREIRKLHEMVSIGGRALVALKMYWKGSRLKLQLGVGVGKNKGDKREDLKERDTKREIDQAMKSFKRG